jgi:selenocysteine lyase/cysteine desulfurase
MELLFDAAASVAPSTYMMEYVGSIMNQYGSVHRGSGARSIQTSSSYEEARREIAKVLEVPDTHCVIFTDNTTDSINKLATALPVSRILTSDIEHSSNFLPWKMKGHNMKTFKTTNGLINIDEINIDGIDLISLTGSSNITGQIVDLEKLYRRVNKEVPIFVDCSQRAAHMETKIGIHCDALALSGHKIGAPFGGGILVVPTKWMEDNSFGLGGGSIYYVDENNEMVQKAPPYNWESGTPNTLGAVTIAKALLSMNYQEILERDKKFEKWYKDYVIPFLPKGVKVLWCNGATLMLSYWENHKEVLNGVEYRAGAFCCYEAFRRVLGKPKQMPPEKEWGGVRLSAHKDMTEEHFICVGSKFKEVLI